MKTRHAELLAAETITSAGTKTIDLNIKAPVSRISVLMKLTNNGSVPTAHPAKSLLKLEVVDGSDILASLTGYECQALNFYEQGRLSYNDNIYLDNVMNLIAFDIFFGRFLYDRDFALVPGNHKNPQIKIQHSLALGGSVPDSLDLRVRADVFDEDAPNPRGFLMSKEIYSYSLVSSGNEYIDLPCDAAIRNLLIMSVAASKGPYEQYNQLKLTEENDNRVILEGYTSDFFKTIAGRFPLVFERLYGACNTSGVDHFITSSFGSYPSLNAEGTNATIYAEAFVNGQTKKIYGSATSNFHGIYSGMAPHGALNIPMGDPNDPDDWWHVENLKSARLKVTGGSSVEASSTAQIVAQQMRPY